MLAVKKKLWLYMNAMSNIIYFISQYFRLFFFPTFIHML